MKNSKILAASLTIICALFIGSSYSIDGAAIDSDAIVQKVLEVEAKQKAEIQNVVFDAEYVEMEKDGDGGLKEKMRLEKTITLRYIGDSTTFEEKYTAYYKDGELMSEDQLNKVAKEKTEKRKKRAGKRTTQN